MLQLRFVDTARPPVWLVEETYILGSGSGCHIHLSGSSIKPRHAQLSVHDEKVSITPAADDTAVLVNGSRIYVQTPLVHDTKVQFGECHLLIVDPKRERSVVAPTEHSSKPSWVLQSKTTALANKLFPIGRGMLVGRARECDLCLAVAHLSRRHARLFFEGGGLWVEDLNSANGTFVNGRRIAGRARLRDGDELTFDTLGFVVRGEAVAEPDKTGAKTSLRPSIVAEIAAVSAAPESGVRSERVPSPAKPTPRRLLEQDADESAGQSSALFWGGIVMALLLTMSAIVYFAA